MDSSKGITFWYSVPLALIQLVEHGKLNRTIMTRCAGSCSRERFSPSSIFAAWCNSSQAAYSNLYGPTETNVCTYYHVQPSYVAPEQTEPVPIARPAPTPKYLRSIATAESCPGQEGELYCAARR